MTDAPDSPALIAEAARLIFPRFTEDTALALGLKLVELARASNLPVVVNIRGPDRTWFHAALPGSTPLNDRWARRKSASTLAFHKASLLVGTRIRENGGSLEKNGLSPEDFSGHGGAVPIRVEGVGVVAAVTVSGLPQVEDHRLAVRAIEALLSGG